MANTWSASIALALATTAGLFWGNASIALADTVVITGEVRTFTNIDTLNLDPASAIIAVDVFGDEDREVNGVLFRTDKDAPAETPDGVTAEITATNSIDDWSNAPDFEGSDPDSVENLSLIMQDIRWEGAPNSVLIDVTGLNSGQNYEIQLLFNEGADRNRVWDIAVNEELAVDNISSEGIYGGDDEGVWDTNNSAVYKGTFAASGDGELNIDMAMDLGGEPQEGADNNPIIQAVIISTVGDPALVGWWPLTEGSGDELNDSSGNNDAAELVDGEWIDATGDNLPDFLAGQQVPGFDGDATYALLGEEAIPTLDEDTALTIAFWSNQVAGGSGVNNIVLGNRYQIDGTDFAPREFIKFTPTQFEFHQNGVGDENVAYDEPIPDDTWTHHAIVKEGNNFAYYRNGVEVNTHENSGLYPINPLPLFIGGQQPGGEHWSGSLADIGLWTRSLSAADVAAIASDGIAAISGITDADTDNDGMLDSYEENNGLEIGVDDSALDLDEDGLTNIEEFEGTTDAEGKRIRPQTLANKADSDEDGLSDKVETNTGTFVSAEDTGTNPRKDDTDQDGLKDGAETQTGVFVSATNTGTSPLNDDSDGDGRKDGREVASNTDPNDSSDPPPPDPTDIVTGYWPMDADLKDASGNGGDGILMDGDDDIPDFVEGKLGTALSLDGISEYVEINPDLEDLYSGYDVDAGEPNPDGFSVSAWFKVGLWDKSWQALVAKGEGNRWRVHRRGGETVITGNGGNGDVPNNSLVEPEDDEWHHLVLTSNPTEDLAQLWVDGQLEGENSGLNLEDNDNPMMIGENPDARNRTWNGLVDDVAFFKRYLTEEEVLMLWNDGEGATVGEVFLGAAGGLGFRVTNVDYVNGAEGAADQVRVTWASSNGASYAVDSSQTLPEITDAWQEVADGVASDGDLTSFDVTVPQDAVQFYLRIRKE